MSKSIKDVFSTVEISDILVMKFEDDSSDSTSKCWTECVGPKIFIKVAVRSN